MEALNNEQCRYIRKDCERCEHPAQADGLCFWHNPKAQKKGADVKDRLEEMVHQGKPLEGFKLAHANLEGINLVRTGSHEQPNLMNVDLYRANLHHAHFFNVNLSEGSLMKANLLGANFNFSNLSEVNLLGTKFNQTKLENINWGDKILQEKQAIEKEKQGDKKSALRLFKEAEEVYRHLQDACEDMSLYDNAGYFLQKKMVTRRYQMPFWSGRRAVSKLVDLTCGYGESPFKVIFFALFVIFFFAILYFFFGIKGSGHIIQYRPYLHWSSNLIYLLDALYFSVVTFTTVGYGDIAPMGITRFFATSEAFIGAFSISLFVVVFVKKMTQ